MRLTSVRLNNWYALNVIQYKRLPLRAFVIAISSLLRLRIGCRSEMRAPGSNYSDAYLTLFAAKIRRRGERNALAASHDCAIQV